MTRWSTHQLATMALLCSLSLLLSFVEFPIFPAAAFLKYDAGFVPIMIVAFIYGPGPGAAVGVVQIALHGLFIGDVPGSVMNICTMLGFVLSASMYYARNHTRAGAYIGLVIGSVVSVACAIAGNLIITPLYMGVTFEAVVVMIVPILLPFNLMKVALNSLLTAFLYKGASNVFKPKHERIEPAQYKPAPVAPLQPTECAVRFSHVSFGYMPEHPVLNNIDLDIPRGAFVCVLGANGSGKSTLSKHVNALLVPDSGDVQIFDVSTRDKNRTYSIRAAAGMVFQDPNDQLVESIVADDVAFGPKNLGWDNATIAAAVTNALDAVELTHLSTAEIASLSLGQKQRVAIAGVLAMNPQILILDEAASSLDPQSRMDLFSTLRRLRTNGMTILMITHNLDEARTADRVMVMSEGRIIADGAPDVILADEALLKRAHLYCNLAEC